MPGAASTAQDMRWRPHGYQIDERNENRQGDNWNLFISNTITGERKVNGIIIGDNCSVDTSGWPAGIYAVNAFRNNEVLSSKIHIK